MISISRNGDAHRARLSIALPPLDRDEVIAPSMGDVTSQWSGLADLVGCRLDEITLVAEDGFDDEDGPSDHRVLLVLTKPDASLIETATAVDELLRLWGEVRDGIVASRDAATAGRVY